MTWVKPYLKNVRRLAMDDKKTESAQLIAAFEGSMIEIEVIALKGYKLGVYSCMNLHFEYRSRPEMKFMQEGYQRGPIHVGRTTMTIRSYAWTKEELENYKKMKEREDLELLGAVDSSVQAAYISLGDDLENYLRESGEKSGPEWEKHKEILKKKTIFEPFAATFKGVGELFGAFGTGTKIELKCGTCGNVNAPKSFICAQCNKRLRKPTRKELFELEEIKQNAGDKAKKSTYNFLKRIKAAHGFIY